MTAPIFRWADAVLEGAEKAGEDSETGGQDTSRTPISPKAAVFQRFGAGASVGARAARKKKASNFNQGHGATAHFGREAGLP